MTEPSETDYAYFAGIIDGEGHIAGRANGDAGIIMCMADTAILAWLHERFGGSFSNTWINERAGSRPRRMLQIRDKQVLVELLPRLLPYLVLKRRETEILLTYAIESVHHRTHKTNRRPEWKTRKLDLAAQMLVAREARKT